MHRRRDGACRIAAGLRRRRLDGLSRAVEMSGNADHWIDEWASFGRVSGFGGGMFHDVIVQGWSDAEYAVAIDIGAQSVDWLSAISDLAERLAAVAAMIGDSLSIRIGVDDIVKPADRKPENQE